MALQYLSCTIDKTTEKSLLWQIVIGDEKWVYYDNSERKKTWVNPGQPITSLIKRNIHCKKLLLYNWLVEYGILYYELLPPN